MSLSVAVLLMAKGAGFCAVWRGNGLLLTRLFANSKGDNFDYQVGEVLGAVGWCADHPGPLLKPMLEGGRHARTTILCR